MSSCKNITLFEPKNYKIKVCLLGGTEFIKNEFQKKISSYSLPIENKKHIGVNISKFEFKYNSDKFEFYLWNIDCNQKFALLRTIFYHGAEAVIIFITESKIEQIRSYLTEVRLRFPIIQIYFCVLLNKYCAEEIRKKIVSNLELYNLIESNNITLGTVTRPHNLFEQISSFFMEKKKLKRNEDNFMINFLDLRKFLNPVEITVECEDYCEPIINFSELNQKFRINREVIIDFLLDLGIHLKEDPPNHLIIENKNYGIFSIFLRNANVFFLPKLCQGCSDKECQKYNKQYFLCIEQTTKGWSNRKNMGQPELLLLSKIIAIRNSELPPTVLKQINKLNTCIKDKSLH